MDSAWQPQSKYQFPYNDNKLKNSHFNIRKK